MRLFSPLNGTAHRSQPSLTTRDRELVSVLEVRIEPGDLNPRPLTPQSVTLPTIPRARYSYACMYIYIYTLEMYRMPKFRDPRMHMRISVHEDPRKRMQMQISEDGDPRMRISVQEDPRMRMRMRIFGIS